VNIKTVLKTSVAAAALVAIGAPAVVSQAEAGINNGNKNSLVMSGQIVRNLIYQDNGRQSQLFHADGVNTRSRIRWIVSGQMTESVSIGGLVEMNFPASNATGSLGTNAVTAGTNQDAVSAADNGEVNTDTGFAIRHSRIDFKHKTAGTLSIGQSSVAGDGATTQSFLSHAAVGSSGGNAEMMRASTFWNDTASSNSGVGSSAIQNYDPSREDRIRYDTPSFGGLKLAVSHQDSGASVAANYSGKFGGVQVAAAAFYRNVAASSTAVDATMGGSIAAKHDSGIAVEFGYSKEDAPSGVAVEGKNWHAGIGYAANLNNLGETGFVFAYGETEEGVADGDEGTSWTVSVNQKVSSVGADIYAGYARATYDDGTATDYDDFNTIFAGTRLNF